jgi:hypothetical protein
VTVTRSAPETIAVTSISLNKTTADLLVDATEQLTATVFPTNATNQNVSWSSSNETVATVSATGLVTAKAEGTATITVTSEDGNKTAICIVNVEKEEEQGIIVEETEPAGANGTGTIELSLTIPSNASFAGVFYIEFPAGMTLDQTLTSLVKELISDYDLTIFQISEGKWMFTISHKPLRRAHDLIYSKIMDIVYHVEAGTDDGVYEIIISDLKFDFDDSTSIIEDEIPVNITVDHNYVGLHPVAQNNVFVNIKDGNLRITSPSAEQISIYSVTGIPLYANDKQAGEAIFNIGHLRDKVLIIKGATGWVRKSILR